MSRPLRPPAAFPSSPAMLRTAFVIANIALLFVAVNLRAADKKPKGPSVEEQATKLRADFASPDPEVRRAAISTMPHSPAASLLMPELFAALKDADGGVR